MKRLVLNIEESKFQTFLEFVKSLDFVSITEEEIPQWQMDEVNKRKELLSKGEMTTKDWESARKDIFKK